jgi:hypothetical protein
MISPVASVERGVQREGAVSAVFKAVPFRAPGRERQHGIQSIQGVNRGLFIGRKHDRVLRRIQIQPSDVGRFLLKRRVVGEHSA